MCKNGQTLPFGGPQMVKITLGIQKANTVNKSGKKWPKMHKSCQKLPKKIVLKWAKQVEKMFPPNFQHFEQILFYDISHNSHSRWLKQIPWPQFKNIHFCQFQFFLFNLCIFYKIVKLAIWSRKNSPTEQNWCGWKHHYNVLW